MCNFIMNAVYLCTSMNVEPKMTSVLAEMQRCVLTTQSTMQSQCPLYCRADTNAKIVFVLFSIFTLLLLSILCIFLLYLPYLQ